MKKLLLTTLTSIALATSTFAAGISFDGNWQSQKIPLKNAVNYSLGGGTLGIQADSAVSVLYRALPESLGGASSASWSWSFDQSVPATDLTRKGGDDRNASVYFVFAPASEAASLRGQSPRKVLGNSSIRAVLYVHGGSQGAGTAFQSPYLKGRGLSIVKHSAGTGGGNVSANVRGDYQRAFGSGDDVLIGIAITSDSDDTKSTISGSISNLSVN